MKQVTVGNGQSIYDIALQEGGDIAFVFLLMFDNPETITSLDTILEPGTKLYIKRAPVNAQMLKYYQDNELKPATGTGVTVSDSPLLNIDDSVLKNINDTILYNLNNG
jgi:hypothetical protein